MTNQAIMFNKAELNQLYRYALSLAVKEDIAYDLLQGALEKYLERQAQQQPGMAQAKAKDIDKPLAYLKTVIRNLYFDQQRHNKVIPMISIESEEMSMIEPLESESMENLLLNQQEVGILISQLNGEENELLYLWAVEEYTADEIAQLYQQPRGTVLSKLHRLKKRLRNKLQQNTLALTTLAQTTQAQTTQAETTQAETTQAETTQAETTQVRTTMADTARLKKVK